MVDRPRPGSPLGEAIESSTFVGAVSAGTHCRHQVTAVGAVVGTAGEHCRAPGEGVRVGDVHCTAMKAPEDRPATETVPGVTL